MSMELAKDYFLDEASIQTPAAGAINALGEPAYGATPAVTVKGLLLPRSSQVWRDLGLAEDVEAVFTTDHEVAPAPRYVVTAGGKTYRRVSIATVRGLEGPAMTRILLHSEAS